MAEKGALPERECCWIWFDAHECSKNSLEIFSKVSEFNNELQDSMNSIIQTFCENLFYVSLYFRINLNFKNIVHFSDSRAEICFIFRSFFGRWSFKKKCFCDLLTFRPFHVTAGSNRESYFNPFPSKQKIRNPGSKLLPVSKITSISLKSCL